MENTAFELSHSEKAPIWLEHFIRTYNSLNKDNLETLANIYHQDIAFEDPFHRVTGLNNLSVYFVDLYENLLSCQFNVHKTMAVGSQAAIYWQMIYRHKKLKGGEPIAVDGHSLLYAQQQKVIYHRDYFDAGQLLYENLPLLGLMVRFVKNKVA